MSEDRPLGTYGRLGQMKKAGRAYRGHWRDYDSIRQDQGHRERPNNAKKVTPRVTKQGHKNRTPFAPRFEKE